MSSTMGERVTGPKESEETPLTERRELMLWQRRLQARPSRGKGRR